MARKYMECSDKGQHPMTELRQNESSACEWKSAQTSVYLLYLIDIFHKKEH
jgi:hypothetical protein